MKITTAINTSDFNLFRDIVNIGIDSHLEAFTKSKFHQEGHRYVFNFDPTEVHILLRRLREKGTEEADSWADDIEASEESEDEVP